MKVSSAHLSRPRDGERVNGDTALVRGDAERTLLAVVDGLGHGPGAAQVADAARAHLEHAPLGEGVLPLIEGLHRHLRHAGPRGAAAMLVLLEKQRIAGCGVGNVELRLHPASMDVPVVLSPGILGSSVRRFRTFEGPLKKGDRLVLFSDGISSRMALSELRALPPQQCCEAIFAQHRYSHDDATVLVADLE